MRHPAGGEEDEPAFSRRDGEREQREEEVSSESFFFEIVKDVKVGFFGFSNKSGHSSSSPPACASSSALRALSLT